MINTQLGNLEWADLQGHCPHCDAYQPVDVLKLIEAYGRGAMLDQLPPQPCLFCTYSELSLDVIDYASADGKSR
jgi:hypothetical protein